MAFNYVTVTGSFPVSTGTVTFTAPTLTDLTGRNPVQGPGPVICTVSAGSFTSPPLLATDNAALLPAGWSWNVTVQLAGQPAYSYPVLIPSQVGTAVLSALPVSPAASITAATSPMTEAALNGYTAWTYNPWTANENNTPTSTVFQPGVVTFYPFHLAAATTVTGNVVSNWRGSTGFANAWVGLYQLTPNLATLLGTGLQITSTGHSTIDSPIGLASLTLPAGTYAFGFLVGTQGGTPVGPLFANNESVSASIMGERFNPAAGIWTQALFGGANLTALPATMSSFSFYPYGPGWFALY